ncbi:MAG: hypothetical protein EPO11_01965 [Gammaproteobacteria bacterium]|nr:MAG: hypothetical protein EPO11_01965 [Gammaproteobacteria bacterium]
MLKNIEKNRVKLICLTGISLLAAVFLARLIAPFTPFLALYLFLVTAITVFIAQQDTDYFFSTFIVALFAIVASIRPVSLELIAIGTFIVLIGQVLCWYFFRDIERRVRVWLLWRRLRLLTQDVFSCFLEPGYASHVYLFERRLHLQKKRFMRALKVLPVKKLETLYNIILDAAQLRRRVEDHHLFSVCASDLQGIAEALNQLFSRRGSVAQLTEKIRRLEETYQHVLQVTAPDPVVFLLFIASLKALAEEI